MNHVDKHLKLGVLSGLLFVLVLSSCFLLSPQMKTAMAQDNHSGGFVIHSEKVDGTINIIAMLFGKVEIGEGEIYGLTITKTVPTAKGNLIVKIKSPGPVPVSNLNGKTVGGLSLPKGICQPGKLGYICFEDVTMTLSEQQVDSIAIPNATIESCYEHECPENKREEVQTAQAKETEIQSLDELNNDLDGLQQQFNIVEDLITKAKTIESTIKNEKQPQQLKVQIEKLGKQLDESEALLGTVNDIHDRYGTFNDHATEFALTATVVDDILKQMQKRIEDYEQYMTELEEALNAFKAHNDSSQSEAIAEKHFAYLQSLAAQHESEEDMNITEVQEKWADIKEKLTAKQSEVKQLEESSKSWNEQLSNFYTKIQTRGKAIEKSEKYTDDERQALVLALDVAEPHKYIEKQIKNLVLQSDEPEVHENLERLETLVAEGLKQLESSKLSVKLIEEIANVTEEIETTLGSQESEGITSSDFKAIEQKLASLSELANMPEQLAVTYKLEPLSEHEKHPFRVTMQDNLQRWKQLPEIFSSELDNVQLEQVINKFNEVKEQIATLKEQIEEQIDELEIDLSDNSDQDGGLQERTFPILDRLITVPTPSLNKQTRESNFSENNTNESSKSEKQSSEKQSSGETSTELGSSVKDKAPSTPAPPAPTPPAPTLPKQNQQDDKRLQQQIANTLRQGQQHVEAIRNTLQQADVNLKKLEQTSTNLTRTILGRHAIKVIPSGEFDTNATKLERHVNSLNSPVKKLHNSIQSASQLLGKTAKNNRQLLELKTTLQEVNQLKIRLEAVRKTLDTYPDYVVFVNTKRKSVDNILKKFDAMPI